MTTLIPSTPSLRGSGRTYANRFRHGAPQYTVDFESTLGHIIEGLPRDAVVAELGAGASPLLSDYERVDRGEFTYYRVDISSVELEKSTGSGGTPVVADVAGDDLRLPAPVDFAVSKMLAEHVADGERFLRNVQRVLVPGGLYLQLAPTLYTVPFLANRLMPERLSDLVLKYLQTKERSEHGKFPARYSWCRGPSDAYLDRISALGFDVVAARGYFGHGYYRRVRPLHALEKKKSAWLAEHPIPALCSFAVLLLQAAPNR